MNVTLPPAAAAAVALSLIGLMIARAVRSGRWPRLPEPDPATVRTARDRAALFAANALAILCGAPVGALLWALPPAAETRAVLRTSAYDDSLRLVGPVFVAMSVALLVINPLKERLVRPAALASFRWNGARRFGRADLRPMERWLGLVCAPLAVALHLQVRNDHTTLFAGEICWRGVFAWRDTSEPLASVLDMQRVRRFRAPIGNLVEREHLVVVFADGQRLRIGRDAESVSLDRAAFETALAQRVALPIRDLDEEQ